MATAVPPRPAELDIHKQQEAAAGRGAGHPSGLVSLGSTSSAGGGRVKPVTLCVFTMKEGETVQKVFPSGRFTTVSQIQETVTKELAISEESSSAFSVWLSSKHLQLQLKSYHLPCKLFKKWKDLLSQYTNASYDDVCQDEPILSFQRNTFFPLKEERKMIDPKKNNQKAIDLLYHEAVFNVTKGRYPLTEDDFHRLAGIQAAAYVAERPDLDPKASSLRPFLSHFYPPSLMDAGSKKALGKLFRQKPVDNPLEDLFSQQYESVRSKCTNAHNLKLLYLQFCWSKPFYGAVMFSGQIERPLKPLRILTQSDKRVTVALNTECLHIFDSKSPPNIMLFLTYDQLSWEFEEAPEDGEDFYSSLWLEFDSVIDAQDGEEKVTKRVRIFSRQAPMMDAMISRCVADIEKTEEELKRKRKEQGCDEVLPECSIQTHRQGESPRVQRQGQNYKENKMRCTTYSKDGEIIDMGFTLSRPFKKRKPRSGSDPSATATTDISGHTHGSSPSQQGHQLQSFQRQRSGTQDSFSSTDL